MVLIFLLFYPSFNHAKILSVGKSKMYSNPIIAIQKSGRGDTVIIYGGYYKVKKLFITKPLTIIGINAPVFDGCNKAEILIINSDSVNIAGLTFKNVPTYYVEDWAAIRLNHADYCMITNNVLENTFFGIYLNRSKHSRIAGNKIYGNAKKEVTAGNAIHLWYSDNATIENNKATRHRDGIYLEFTKNSRITNNISENNLRYGLHFMFCDNNKYIKNRFSRNGAGVAVMFSKNVHMYENVFSENAGSSAYGLLLKDIVNSKIINNKIINNTVGIYADGASRCFLKSNEFSRNGWAIKILGTSVDDTIIMNNFLSNTFDISTNTNMNKNFYSKNYWGKYKGYDLDRDGVGDVPYRPVSLFSFITANSKESLILLRSLFVNLIEFAESITPIFTPSNLSDNTPLMKPVK